MIERKPPAGRRDDDLVPADDAVIGRAFRRSVAAVAVLVVIVGGAWIFIAMGPNDDPQSLPASAAPPRLTQEARAPVPPTVHFTDITATAGIDFVHVNGAAGDKLLPETMGGGCAFFDYDNDGDQDLLLVNSTYWPDRAPADDGEPTMALYRNDGSGAFENVTSGSGLDVSAFGMGIAVGDYDNDGFVDVFISALGRNHLLRNAGTRFDDVTESAGVGGDPTQWGTSSAFFDYDNDGDLDLFVANYVRWTKEIDFEVDYQLTGVGRAYGPPLAFEGTYPDLYRNDGDGTFTDVSAAGGVQIDNPATGEPLAKALGVAPVDVDGDGWIDLLLANDTVRNLFFHNQGNGVFVERGIELGLAFDRNGAATGAMGIDAGYFRDDDSLGFAIGNFANEMTSLYVSQGAPSRYADEAIGAGIGGPSRLALTFGLFFFDYDLDGRLDLLQANGHLEEAINAVQASQHYRQPPQLFWNAGDDAVRTFVVVPPSEVGDLATPLVGRGASYADIDDDGDLDVIITQPGDRPRLLRNEQSLGNRWLRIKLVGDTSNRDGIGAWIELAAGGAKRRRMVMPTRSYLSQVELPVTFGLSKDAGVELLMVTWPGGRTQRVQDFELSSTVVVHQER